MRNWTKPVLAVCVIALGGGLFHVERRISGLEAELSAARAASPVAATPVALRMQPNLIEIQPDAQGAMRVVPVPQSPAAPRIERRPAGEINGVPYYYIPLAKTER